MHENMDNKIKILHICLMTKMILWIGTEKMCDEVITWESI